VIKSQEYEYKGLMAQTWDLLRGDPSGQGDRGFYLEMIRRYGEPVLEVGCGTGRLLLDYLEVGIDIDGIDISPEMLALCLEKADARRLLPNVFEQAIESLSLPRCYRTVVASSSVLQLIVEAEVVRQAVARIYTHLLPGGVLVAPFMTLWKEAMPLQAEWEKVAMRDEDGAMLQRMGRVWYDPQDECEHTEDLYQVFLDGVTVAAEHHRRSPAARSYSQLQARSLFENAGFRDVHLFRGFTQEPATVDDLLFTVAGSKLV
jgi:SAM-dependent methyltransferase